jgi:hypothetical protein
MPGSRGLTASLPARGTSWRGWGRTSASTPHARRERPDMTTMTSPRLKKCPGCQHFVPSTSMVQGECPDCAGLVALPLRTADGRSHASDGHAVVPGPAAPRCPRALRLARVCTASQAAASTPPAAAVRGLHRRAARAVLSAPGVRFACDKGRSDRVSSGHSRALPLSTRGTRPPSPDDSSKLVMPVRSRSPAPRFRPWSAHGCRPGPSP